MSVKWTKNQQEAISFNGNSVIVSAAAGSGKTAVLVERIIKITEKVPVDKLLIVTFTKDAASQMRRKISDAFYEKMTDETLPHDVRANYQTQLMLLPNSLICTIDSLCSKIVKENFEKLGIALNFSVLDPAEAEPMFARFVEKAQQAGLKKVNSGIFQAEMKVELLNDGPVTLLLDSDRLF